MDCPHLKCRENDSYDGEKMDYDFDPDIDRFSLLFDNIKELAKSPLQEMIVPKESVPVVDLNRSLASLLFSLAERHEECVL
jgi:hypothetical protein